MSDKIVWSSEQGDLRKSKKANDDEIVDAKELTLEIRRLTSGKGRTIIEISGLPASKKWCKDLAKKIKKKLATGGAFKDQKIEVHGEKLQELTTFLDHCGLNWKKTGG